MALFWLSDEAWAAIEPHLPKNQPGAHDRQRYRARYLIENAFCRLKDFRRVATRYDKLAANFLSTVALATAVTFWL